MCAPPYARDTISFAGYGGYDSSWRIGPSSPVIEARIGTDGAEDVTSRDGDLRNIFHDAIENSEEIFPAAQDEPGGGDVAVNGAVVGDVVVFGNGPDIAPVDEILLDVLAVGVTADGAFELVAL